MRWVVVINAAGVLAGTAYTGYAISPSHAPLWAGIATFLYLIGLFVPLAAEYGSLDKGFREVGGSFVETRRREKGMGPAQEIFTDAPPPPVFRRARLAPIVAALLIIVATGLLAYDIWER